MSSRERVLGNLRQGKRPFPNAKRPKNYLSMIPNAEQEQSALTAKFGQEAEKAGCVLHLVANAQEAMDVVMQLVGEDTAVSCWHLDQIPIPGLEAAFEQANIACREQDASVRVGITGVDAALAATGSVVVMSGNGRFRAASLLPPIHIAIVQRSQILSDLEGWWARQREQGLSRIRQSSNIVTVSGPSRTADIAMQLVMGMHGPKQLHIVLVL
ncbi:MAG: hypothetical protein GY805_17330 [Chloroflexi bacterium]|nr:hypothetical protein [Chloroflexota bacterium]